MENYFKKIGKMINNGFYDLAKGMSSLNIYPNNKIKVLNNKEANKQDYEAIRGDWEAVGKDLEKYIKRFSLKKII